MWKLSLNNVYILICLIFVNMQTCVFKFDIPVWTHLRSTSFVKQYTNSNNMNNQLSYDHFINQIDINDKLIIHTLLYW